MPHIAGLRGVLENANGARDPGRAVYRYHQTFPGPGRTLTRKGVICAVRLSPWAEGMIRPHEQVGEAERAAALTAIEAAGGHPQMVVAGVRDQAGEIDRLLRKFESSPAALRTTTADGVQHVVWRVNDAEIIGKLRNYLAQKKLHVLAGHDLYEGMLAYQAKLSAKQEPTMYSAANYGLFDIIALEDQALVAAPRHRIIRGTTATSAEVLAGARKYFIVDKLAGIANDAAKLAAALVDSLAHQPAFIAVFAGDQDAYKLTLSPEVSPINEGAPIHRALAKLDPVVIQYLFIEKLLPGAQLASDTDAKRALGAGGQITLIVRPVSIDQIAHVDELNQVLPAQSTALYPAIASVVSFPVDANEDLV